MSEKPEIPALVFRKVLPFIRTRDMSNVEKAVQSSEALYNEFSFHTKKHSKTVYPDSRLICPYCLVSGGLFNPWHRVIMAIYKMAPKVWAQANVGIALYHSGPYILVESETLEDIKERCISRDESNSLQGLPENRFRRWTQIWAEEYDREKSAQKLLIALRDLNIYTSAGELVNHIESAHHPSGSAWKAASSPSVRAHDLDEIVSLIMGKQFQGSIITQSPRKNRNLHNAMKTGASNRKRGHGDSRRYLNPGHDPTPSLYSDKVQNIHMTISLCYQLEDNLQRLPRKHLVIDPKFHKLLALRDFLACQVEVFEKITFDDLTRDTANHFGFINAIKLILDSILQLPY